jgi:D-beta-D-heptose 7-phosphate kinase/D-beta-D-heptose 1-phosphate adenosyltransferase
MIDLYHIGTATRLSAEAPIPIVEITETRQLPGGAANVAVNLSELVYSDATPSNLQTYTLTYTGPIKNRLMVDGIQIARWDVSDTCEELPIERVEEVLTGHNAVLIADYNKGAVTRRVIDQVMRSLTPNSYVFIDTKTDPIKYISLEGPRTYWFPNAKEYDKYQSFYDQRWNVVLKNGPGRIMLLKKGLIQVSYPTMARKVVSVNGAGDTVMAAFAYARVQLEHTNKQSLVFANAAAAVVVEKPYTAIATLKEVQDVYRHATGSR